MACSSMYICTYIFVLLCWPSYETDGKDTPSFLPFLSPLPPPSWVWRGCPNHTSLLSNDTTKHLCIRYCCLLSVLHHRWLSGASDYCTEFSSHLGSQYLPLPALLTFLTNPFSICCHLHMGIFKSVFTFSHLSFRDVFSSHDLDDCHLVTDSLSLWLQPWCSGFLRSHWQTMFPFTICYLLRGMIHCHTRRFTIMA